MSVFNPEREAQVRLECLKLALAEAAAGTRYIQHEDGLRPIVRIGDPVAYADRLARFVLAGVDG